MANATNGTEYAPLWVSEPNGRGTWSILYSCVFTLSLCVWSAIHLNVPPKGERAVWQWIRKTKWVFIAIFAPEVVLYSAFQQYYLARRFCKEMKDIYRVQHHGTGGDTTVWWERGIDRCGDILSHWFSSIGNNSNSSGTRKVSQAQEKLLKAVDGIADVLDLSQEDTFSMTYGYFVVMGGFVIDVRSLYDEHKPPQKKHHHRKPSWLLELLDLAKSVVERISEKRDSYKKKKKKKNGEKHLWLTLTPRAVIEFAQLLEWDDFRTQFCIDEEVIEDKSKADLLAKMLVSLQVLWAILNSISRVVLGYPISVLEIHTLVHAACALVSQRLIKELFSNDMLTLLVP